MFATNIEVVAMPLASVRTVVEFVPVLTNVPLTPLAGAVNVTLTFGTGLP